MRILLPYLLMLPLCSAWTLPAQDNGKGQDPPSKEQIKQWVQALRAAPSVAAASALSEPLRIGSPESRAALLKVLRGEGQGPEKVNSWVIEGVAHNFLAWNDRGDDVLDAMCRVLMTGEPALQPKIREIIQEYDSQGSLLPDLKKRLAVDEQGQTLEPILGMIEALIDTDEERLTTVEDLIRLLEKGTVNGFGKAVGETLYTLTFRRFDTPKEWRIWFDAFRAGHPDGFSLIALHEDVLLERAAPGTAEALRAVNRLVVSSILPTWYLNLGDYPDPLVRAAAAEGLLQAAGDDAAKLETAGEMLLNCFRTDPDPLVRRAAARGLVNLVQDRDGLRVAVAEAFFPHLENTGDLETLEVVIRGLRRCAQLRTAVRLGAVYRHADILQNPKAVGVRRQIVTSLVSLQQSEYNTITEALRDDDANVRKDAGNSLVALPGERPEREPYALALAEACGKEKDPGVLRSFVNNIRSLGIYTSPLVVSALRAEARADGPNQDEALRGLLGALAREGTPDREALRDFLVAHLPEQVPDQGVRESLLKMLTGPNPEVAQVALAWCAREPVPSVRRSLAALLAPNETLPMEDVLKVIHVLKVDQRDPKSAEILIKGMETRATRPGAPKEDADRLTQIRALLAETLLDQSRGAEAEEVLNAEIAREKGRAELYWLRGRLRREDGRRKEALADLYRAHRLGKDQLPPAVLQQILVDLVELSLELKRDAGAQEEAVKLAADIPKDQRSEKLRTRLEIIARTRSLVDQLADPDPTKAAAAAVELKKNPEDAGTWLLHAAIPPIPIPALSARLTLFKQLFPDAPLDSPLPTDPPLLKALTTKTRTWWQQR